MSRLLKSWKPGAWKALVGPVAIVALLLVARQAFAEAAGGHEDPGGHAETDANKGAPAGHGASPKHHGPDIGEDHWNIFWQFAPGAVANLRAAWGKTWIQGDPMPGRTMHVIIGVVVFILALGLASACSRKFAKGGDDAVLPERNFGWFTLFELCGEWIYKTMIDTMGPKQARFFFPLIFSLGTFILFSNLIGMVPGFVSATDNLNTTIPLALTVFFATHVYGVKEQGFTAYFGHFFGPMRGAAWLPLMLLMFMIEIVSHLARPASLAIRLMGNMFGDHQVLGVFLSFGILLIPLPLMMLGTLVCVVQTLVFCLLSIVYIALAVQNTHSDDHDSAHAAH